MTDTNLHHPEIENYFETKANFELLKWAAGTQIFSRYDQTLMHWNDTVVVTGEPIAGDGWTLVLTGAEFDRLLDTIKDNIVGTIEVVDGRRFTKAGKLRKAHDTSVYTIETGQEEE